MAWHVAAGANLVVGAAYLAISWAILRPLLNTRQVPGNLLGTATAAIFFTCAVHHGAHAFHLLGPIWGIEEHSGLHLREAFNWHQASWDVLSAIVALWYWSLRSHYGSLMRGAALFADLKERQRQALEINDNIVQGLAVAKLALELEDHQVSREALESALGSARQIISDLLGESGTETRLGPGDLVRRTPAAVRDA